MTREQKTKGIILKKQAYGEADEIITVFTKEFGKLRVLGKATKKATSKLQYALQTLSEVELTLAKGNASLPRVIRVTPVTLYPHIRENAKAMAFFFWLAEVVIKSTPDEQPSDGLYALITSYLSHLDKQLDDIDILVIKFSLELLTILGLSIQIPLLQGKQALYFSNDQGGFVLEEKGDAVPIAPIFHKFLLDLQKAPLTGLLNPNFDVSRLKVLVLGFVRYQIEREIRAEQFLNQELS